MLQDVLESAGFDLHYMSTSGKIQFEGESLELLKELPKYAWDGADLGTQDSELLAESLRYVAVNGKGVNAIADAIADLLLGG